MVSIMKLFLLTFNKICHLTLKLQKSFSILTVALPKKRLRKLRNNCNYILSQFFLQVLHNVSLTEFSAYVRDKNQIFSQYQDNNK